MLIQCFQLGKCFKIRIEKANTSQHFYLIDIQPLIYINLKQMPLNIHINMIDFMKFSAIFVFNPEVQAVAKFNEKSFLIENLWLDNLSWQIILEFIINLKMESKKAEITEYLTSKMYGFLQPMLVDVMKSKPDNTVQYCINWLQKYQDDRIDRDASDDQSDSVDDKVFEKKKNAARIASNSHKRSRIGISEEVFGSFNKKSKFAPKNVEKSEQSRILILSLIRNSILFRNINSVDEQLIIDAMGQRDCSEGQTIIQEGGDGNELYIVSSGQFDCYKTLNGKETYLKTYNYGESFGQLALMYNAPRAATIRVKAPGKLFTLDRQTFSSVVKEANIRRREMLQTVVSKIDIFAELDNYQKQQFYDILKQEKVQTGQYIIKQGQKGDRFYIVVDGKFAAEKETGNQEKQVVYNYREGDYFGQLALINDIDRQASVKALTSGRLFSIDRVAFMRILGSMKDILQRNAVRYEKYQCNLICSK